jgi:predicted glycoside hydrolase/deacetylase ChbG (UPF0249 family)
MRVIINADDFGYSDESVRATIELFERGVLSSATIMPRMPATRSALEFARRNPAWSFGVHLTFITDDLERPLMDPGRLPTLIRADGRFYSTRQTRLRALLGLLSPEEIATEMRAQIGSVIEAGVAVSHVDSHGHTHKLAAFRDVLRAVLPEFGIGRVRSAQNVYLARPLSSATFWLGRRLAADIRTHFVTTDRFFMPTAGAAGVSWADRLLQRMHGADGSLEVGVHPGREEAWRHQEAGMAARFSARIAAAGHEMISWNDLRPDARQRALAGKQPLPELRRAD